ncbi:MAG: diguanylate cyclase [Dehalococcoidia bacterium]|nr:diguanylate cyclase [Dehalococcoidia bacterium]
MDVRDLAERARIRPPEPRRGREATFARNYRRFSTVLLAIMVPLELYLLTVAPLVVVLLLMGCTFALITMIGRGWEFLGRERSVAVEAASDRTRDMLLRDPQTGLPNRQYLIDELTRDVARTGRYGEPLTLAVLEIAGTDRLRAAWGEGVVDRAGRHVAETLRRITRTSDFIARIDDTRFAALLVQCSDEQATAYIDRASLAVANRPLRAEGEQRVPVYVMVNARATQFDAERFRGPLEFLSKAGADLSVPKPGAVVAGARPKARGDARNIRRQLIREADVGPGEEQVIGRKTAS